MDFDALITDLSSDAAEVVQEAILDSAFCFEKIAGHRDSGWSNRARELDISAQEAGVLKEALWGVANSAAPSNLIGSAIWALGKSAVPADKKRLIALLRAHVDGDSTVLYQLLCVLSALGEPVFETGSTSVLDEVANRSVATSYLLHI